MNKQQIIQTYKSARNVKINIENELVQCCTVTDLIEINERNLAIRRHRMDNPHLTDNEARDYINMKYAARNKKESEVIA